MIVDVTTQLTHEHFAYRPRTMYQFDGEPIPESDNSPTNFNSGPKNNFEEAALRERVSEAMKKSRANDAPRATTYSKGPIICARCGIEAKHEARGYCRSCYSWFRRKRASGEKEGKTA